MKVLRQRLSTTRAISRPTLGGLIVGLLSWAGIRDWRTLQLVCSTPALLLLSYQWLIPESPRWLLAVKKFERLEKDIERTAKKNGRARPTEVMKRLRSDHESETGKPENTSASLLDLFRPMPIALRNRVHLTDSDGGFVNGPFLFPFINLTHVRGTESIRQGPSTRSTTGS